MSWEARVKEREARATKTVQGWLETVGSREVGDAQSPSHAFYDTVSHLSQNYKYSSFEMSE